MLEPSVKDMLEIGKGCGLSTVQEAYDNYMNHYDMFFLIEDYTNQYIKFVQDLKETGFVNKDMTLKDFSIIEGLERVAARSSSGKSS